MTAPLRDRAIRAVPFAVATSLALLLAACGQGQQQQAFHGFPPAQVTTVKVEPQTLPAVYEYVGQTTGSKEVEVRARVTGILEKKLFQEGAQVRAGQTLFVIDPRQLQAQTAALDAEVVRAQAQKAQADRELARLKPLAEKRAVGQKEADDAQSNVDLAVAAVRAAQARLDEVKLNLAYTNVRAPISGLSSRAPKSEGSLVTANDTLLTTVSQVDPMWIPFAIAETEQLAFTKAVKDGRLTIPKNWAFDVAVQLSDGSVLERKGRINFADTRVNPSTGTFEVRAEVPNSDGALKPGQFVRVKLMGATRNNAIAVPQIAVMDSPQGKFVYVAGKDKDGKDVAEVRVLQLGEWAVANGANLWIVESGLKPGDMVIVDNTAKLRPGAAIVLGGAPPAGAVPGAPGTPAGAAAPKSPATPVSPAAPAKDAPAAPKA